MRQLDFAAPFHPTEVRREIKRMFHLRSDEISRAQMKVLLEQAMQEVVTEQVQADPYERAPERVDRRNGSYPRRFLTLCGLVDLRVPRARGSETPFKVVMEAYRQREQRLDELIRLIFLNGISTRDVGSVIKALTGHPVSASTVSAVTAKMGGELRAFHSRRIEDHYVYLILDGVRVRFRTFAGAVHRLVLCAVGITADGTKELIDFLITTSESENNWGSFLNDLYHRGLEGKKLSLAVTDGNRGVINTLGTLYPRVKRQRCFAHKMRNVASKLPRRIQKDCMGELKKIYGTKTRREAHRVAREWARRWKRKAPKAVDCLMEGLDELLLYMDMPERDWKTIRTTNVIERSFREVRRRIRPMTIFSNNRSCDRILVCIFNKLNGRWKKRRTRKKTNLTQKY